VPFRDPHRSIAEQHRHPFNRHSSQEQLDGKRIAKTVSVPVGDLRKFKELLQSGSPVSDGGFKLTRAGPEPKPLARRWSPPEGIAHHIRKDEIDGYTGLLRLEE
jgi:hypothetical protein